MASQGQSRGDADLLHFLTVHRVAVYLGGLVAIFSPTLLEKSGVVVSSSMRTVIVLASLVIMVTTYVGERRFVHGRTDENAATVDSTEHFERVGRERGDDAEMSGDATDSATASTTYPRRTRLTVALAVAGLAVGFYVAVEVSPVAGIAFVAGAYFFGYFAFRGEDGGN
ncbi:hypothetical protein [Haladaptatus halobius]|uniref:hypothetical protein n=1 Tax=Haladaptatus halobius TaxID=2884875 RepID=UPI001D09FECD|nr:hypothetical protein [Haladaptatus halobius]